MATKAQVKAKAKVAAKRVIKLADLTDEELIARFTKGCSLSFEQIISRYETKVHSLAMRLTRNTEDAEEVLQDVFVTVYRKIEGFEGKSKFSSWLYRITVNAAFMKLRKRKQDQSVSLDDMCQHAQNKALNIEERPSERSDIVLLNKEVKEAVESAISRLPEEYRAVFVLRDVDGLSNKEVGEILDLSIPAVKSRLHRSRLMLRRKLRKFYEDYSTSKIITGPQVLQNAA